MQIAANFVSEVWNGSLLSPYGHFRVPFEKGFYDEKVRGSKAKQNRSIKRSKFDAKSLRHMHGGRRHRVMKSRARPLSRFLVWSTSGQESLIFIGKKISRRT